jgi:C4-dicarboxylate-specific signal transduction histidine kinase
MAHELRQPLTAIGSSVAAGSNWLKRVPPDLEQVRVSLASIEAANQRAADIIASVRDLFKKRVDHRTMIRVDEVARQVLNLVQQDLILKEVSVSTEFDVDLPKVDADRTLLQQVILNLVKNSIDAMEVKAPGTRRLRLATSLIGQSSVVLHIKDSGPGITSENTDRVFNPFFTTKPSGMGLGLSICRTIVEDHQGQLRLAKTDSDGCLFEIVLPIGRETCKNGSAPRLR